MKRKMMWAAAGLVGFLAITGFRASWGGCEGHGHGGPERAEKFVTSRIADHLDELNATDEQRTQVLALKDEVFREAKDTFTEGRKAKGELLQQWDSAKPDANAVHALVDDHLDRIRSMAHTVADAALKLHAILTPEQRAQVSEKIHARVDAR
ncbi:MAG: Spy/CpxP family protein refolding chaperone [Myxococcota bacterium]